MQKAIRDAKKNMITVPLVEGTLPHGTVGRFKAATIVLRPAYPGTGVIAGRTVGTICRMAGIEDILTKALDSTNPLTLARATMEGFRQMRTLKQVAELRDKTVEEISYEAE
jgi:small subunit ribosomal protein S5